MGPAYTMVIEGKVQYFSEVTVTVTIRKVFI